MPTSARLRSRFLLLALAGLLGGCGRGFEKPVAPVAGTVSVDGSAVTEGYVIFTPVLTPDADPMKSGKSATGVISSDGSFEMTTYDEGDGALVGRHMARFFKPDPEDDEQVVKDPYLPGGREAEVEVREGRNQIDINLRQSGEPEISYSGS